jgi:hypothetical protein
MLASTSCALCSTALSMRARWGSRVVIDRERSLKINDHACVALSNRTLALLARPFEGGTGPSHATIELIWTSADAFDYLPTEGNKLERVLGGLRALQLGGRSADGRTLEPDEARLRHVTAALSARLMAVGLVDPDALEAALARDALALRDDDLAPVRPPDEPADRLAEHVLGLFGGNDELDVARNHYEQASRAFDRGDWEAANGQFRSAVDAVYDSLAHALGCPRARAGGRARQWLQQEGHLEEDEADLLRTFMTFAGRAGSHAGLSDATDAQLRRHFATALIAFAVAKLGS